MNKRQKKKRRKKIVAKVEAGLDFTKEKKSPFDIVKGSINEDGGINTVKLSKDVLSVDEWLPKSVFDAMAKLFISGD